jgi:predicted nucleic acid-binding protein
VHGLRANRGLINSTLRSPKVIFFNQKVKEKDREYAARVTLDLAVKELANALRKKVSGNEMSFEIAARIIRDVVEGKPFPVEPQEPYLVEAFEMALRNDVTVYDALFVAMAKRKGLELVTCDEKQAKAARREGVKAVLLG